VWWLLGALGLAAWAFYVSRFLTFDFSFLDVYANVSAGMPLYYRLAASLVNVGGVFLYVSAISGAVALAARSGRIAAVSVAFLAAGAALGAFARWDGGGPGIGLNPLLRSPWAVPHPVLVLTAYALVLSAVAERRLAQPLMRLAWTFATAGMALGGYWSYTTFGWGGYWAWDPVETALFVLWLFLTAYLHGGGGAALYMSAAAVFLTMAVTYSGVSPLHSFAGVVWAGRIALIPSLLLLAAGFLALARERGRDPAYLGLLAVGLYVYWLMAPSVAASLVGAAAVAPSGDGAIDLIHPVLIPATAAALVLMMKGGLGARPTALWTAASAALAVALWQAKPWSPASHPLTNLSIYLLSLLAAGAAVASILQFRRSPGAAVAHLGLALVVAGAALSGPYAYHMSYAAVLALDEGESALVPLLPYGEVNLGIAGAEVVGPRELVSIPPYLEGYVSGDLVDIAAALRDVAGRVEFRRFRVNGTDLVVAFGGFPPGVHAVGETWIYVNSTVDTPAGRLLVGVIGRGNQPLFFSPSRYGLATAVFTCGLNETALNYVGEIVRLTLDGDPLDMEIRYETAGEFKLVRGLVHGVTVKPRGLDDVYLAVTTEVAQWGNMSVPRLLITTARVNLDRCNAVGTWLLLSAYAGKPLTAEEAEELMAQNPRGYVVLVKMIPFVNLVWIGAALATAGGIVSTVQQARSPRRRSA
jgi:cytochrome c-type biogenesis protein CcmF